MALFRAAKIFICTTLVLYCPNAGNIFSEKKRLLFKAFDNKNVMGDLKNANHGQIPPIQTWGVPPPLSLNQGSMRGQLRGSVGLTDGFNGFSGFN